MGKPFLPRIQLTNNDEEEEITREDQVTRDLAVAWEVSVDQYGQREAQQRVVPKSMVWDELSAPLAVYALLGQR